MSARTDSLVEGRWMFDAQMLAYYVASAHGAHDVLAHESLMAAHGKASALAADIAMELERLRHEDPALRAIAREGSLE